MALVSTPASANEQSWRRKQCKRGRTDICPVVLFFIQKRANQKGNVKPWPKIETGLTFEVELSEGLACFADERDDHVASS